MLDIITSKSASVEVDRRCNKVRSKVRSGQVGRRNSGSVGEHTPCWSVNAENAIVAAVKGVSVSYLNVKSI